jgi:hypothetical protein
MAINAGLARRRFNSSISFLFSRAMAACRLAVARASAAAAAAAAAAPALAAASPVPAPVPAPAPALEPPPAVGTGEGTQGCDEFKNIAQKAHVHTPHVSVPHLHTEKRGGGVRRQGLHAKSIRTSVGVQPRVGLGLLLNVLHDVSKERGRLQRKKSSTTYCPSHIAWTGGGALVGGCKKSYHRKHTHNRKTTLP